MPGDGFIVSSPIEVVIQPTTPTNPDTGYVRIYPKPDGNWYGLTASGVETLLGSGSGSAPGRMFFLA